MTGDATSDAVSPPTNAPRTLGSKMPLPIHPALFALFPLLSLFAANIGELEWRDAILPFLLAVIVSVLLNFFLGKAVRDRLRGAVLATLLLTAFFAFGRLYPLRSLFRSIGMLFNPEAVTVNVDWLLLIPWLLLIAALAIPCLRSRRNFAPLTALLNVMGVVLVAQPALTIALHWRQIAAVGVPQQQDTAESVTGFPTTAFSASGIPAASANAPDIYFILLDAYGRQDVLQKYYDLDNRPFVQDLEKRGFYVAPKSRPNYEQTVCSIGSTLNMRYLDDLTQRYGRVVNNKGIISELIDKNAVATFARKHGYRFVSIASDFPMTATPSADISWSKPTKKSSPHYFTLNSFEVLLLNVTPLDLIPMATRSNYDDHRDLLLANFQALRDAPKLPGRNLFFAHILAPHPPFVFGPEGQALTPNRPYTISDGSDWMRRGTRDTYRKGYADQLRYINTCVLQTVDGILARSTVRPVILIQGDHGPRMFLDWESLSNSDVGETYGNLCAYYLPDGKARQVFYPTITPVNSFRLLFDHYFADAHLTRLPDRSYFSPLQHPFDFTDVTDKAP